MKYAIKRENGSQLSRSTIFLPSRNMGRTKPILSAEYIVGLTDGEGCFYVNVSKMQKYRVGVRIQLHFHIKLNERDRDLLESVREALGCGSVYYQKETRANHAQCFRYTVSSQRDIFGIILPFFQQHHLQSSSKQSSFIAFCQIAHIVEQKRHLTEEGVKQIRLLKATMNKKIGLA